MCRINAENVEFLAEESEFFERAGKLRFVGMAIDIGKKLRCGNSPSTI